PEFDPGRGSADVGISEQISGEPTATTIETQMNTVDALVSSGGLPKPDFVKIDVEGYERPVLEGMYQTITRYHPRLFIEIHGATQHLKSQNIQAVVKLLSSHNYAIHHVESGAEITVDTADLAREGHVYCTHNHLNGGIVEKNQGH